MRKSNDRYNEKTYSFITIYLLSVSIRYTKAVIPKHGVKSS